MDDSKSLWLLILVLLVSVFSSSLLYAAERLSLAHMSFDTLRTIIPVNTSGQQSKLARPLDQDFLVLERHRDVQKTEHIRLQQRYKGFPVLGGYAVLHHKQMQGSQSVVQLNGAIYQKLQHDLGDVPLGFVEKASDELQAYSQQFPHDQIVSKMIQPIIYMDDQHRAHWAYRMMVYVQPEQRMPSQPTVIKSAKTGETLLKWDALTTLQHIVKGMGFGGNRRIGKYQFGKDVPYLDLIRDDEAGICFLANAHMMVVDMHHDTHRPNIPMYFDCEESSPAQTYWTGYAGDGFDQVNGSYSVSNDAMYFGGLVSSMYRSQYGVEVLQRKKQGIPLIFRVHFSTYYANAFWDGRQMTFGDGDGTLHPLVGLSITAHEISHGFTQQHSGLLYHGQAGGINEAFSDMAAQAAEYFVHGEPSWQIGADVVKNQGALRSLKHPSLDGVSIERAIDYQTDMEVHQSSGVYNRLFYLLATHSGWDLPKAFHVMLKANMDYWTPTTSFAEGACGVLAASKDLGLSEEDVKDALDEVVIDYGDC